MTQLADSLHATNCRMLLHTASTVLTEYKETACDLPSGLRTADHLAGLGVASIMDELCNLRGLPRARLSHKDGCLALVNHVYEIVACLPYRQTCVETARSILEETRCTVAFRIHTVTAHGKYCCNQIQLTINPRPLRTFSLC
jgi:hypothetical protein